MKGIYFLRQFNKIITFKSSTEIYLLQYNLFKNLTLEDLITFLNFSKEFMYIYGVTPRSSIAYSIDLLLRLHTDRSKYIFE